MVKTSKRALRRHHRRRMVEKALNIRRSWWTAFTLDEVELQRQAVREADNIKCCSCQMCCNARRCDWSSNIDKLTLNERRALDRFNQQMEDIVELPHDI